MLAELAAAVQNGRTDPVDLVQECLRRIEAHNPRLNAVVALRAEEALAEARSHPRNGPLAGVPFLVKDLEHAAGMATSFGSRLHADNPPVAEDDVVVARLREAGAVVVGKTNTPEFGWTAYTTNPVYGPTHNPWTLGGAPGGSSGGSAAALIAGRAPLATSSDGGGSVRIPAAECGLVGYKPTFGAIGRNFLPNWIGFSMDGVLGRTVADVLLEASVTAGPARGDIMALPAGSISLEPRRPTRVVACPTLREATDPAVLEAFQSALATIGDDLAVPVEETTKVFDTDPDVLTAWLLIGAAELGEGLSWAQDRHDELDPGLRMMATMGAHVKLYDYVAAQRARFQAAAQIDDLLGDDTVLVTPTCNATSWPVEGPLPMVIAGVEGSPVSALNTPDFNFTGHPAVSVPMGIGPEGVPMGLQIVAPRFRDDLALGLAAALEAARPWPLVAPGYEAFPI